MSLRDFVLPGFRDVMPAERAVLEVSTSQPFDRVGGLRDGGQLPPIF